MKTIKVTKPVNLSLLAEELYSAFPEWITVSPFDGKNVSSAWVGADEIGFPDETDARAVQAVIDAHDPAGKSINQRKAEEKRNRRAEMADKASRAVSVPDLREIVLYILDELD